MNKLIIAAIVAMSATVAHADMIDDEVTKAYASVERAEKKLEVALACQADKETCKAERRAKIERDIERATARLAALTTDEVTE